MSHRNILFLGIALLVVTTAFTPRRSGKPAVPKAVRKQYIEVPAGDALIGMDRTPVGSFFLSRSEVTNLAYREFLADLKRSGDEKALAMSTLDSSQWVTELAYCEPFRVHYQSHPAFNNYPVVNVSQPAAVAYCTWLEGKLNAMAPEGTYYKVRLPSHVEWVRAAQGVHGNTPYAWGGPYLRNNKGCYLANFRVSRGDTLTVAAQEHDNAEITAPVESYFPNDLGLYCMNGNVAEWVAEPGLAAGGSWQDGGQGIRNESIAEVRGPAPTVGFRPLVEVVVVN